MNRQYFLLWYRLGSDDRYIVWFSDKTDGCVLDDEGTIPSFPSQQQAAQFAARLGLQIVDEEPKLHDLDTVDQWIHNKRLSAIDCEKFLAAWNLFEDVSKSVNGAFNHDRALTNGIYDKIFHGNNIPEITPAGKSYEPLWCKEERDVIRNVLGHGFLIFRAAIKNY